MLLKSLTLKNIRSYDSLTLKFREGSTLLSGDIGSGKTTILLAIEFALFGIMRGVISGSALLRHGKKEGSVELEFDIDGKKVKIARSLKKTSTGIVQDAGFIEINDERLDGTAVELKSKILELLGYPEQLVSKSKSLIFRYTVYTPQEEMKQILYESNEERLEKLRKIFDMDKYKRIRENASDFSRNLRSEMKADLMLIEGLEQLKESLKETGDELEEKKKSFSTIKSQVELSRKAEEVLKKRYEELEKGLKGLENLKNQLRLAEQEKKSNKELLIKYEQEEKTIEVKELKEGRSSEIVNKEFLEEQKMSNENDRIITKLKNNLAVIESRKGEAKKLFSAISHLKECPTCKQDVKEEHKKLVERQQKEKLGELEEKESKYGQFLTKANHDKERLLGKIEKLREEKTQVDIYEQNKKHNELQKERKSRLAKIIIDLKQKMIVISENEVAIRESLNLIDIDEKKINEAKGNLESKQKETRLMEIREAEIKQTVQHKEQEKVRFENEINVKQKKKKEIESKKKTENWISSQFIPVVDVIEKHIFVSIHREFNQRFQEWFNVLMDDESISATVDDSFAPVVIQNGYENEVSNLSGGEKTSVALAYRLALNKVINDFMTSIKTRDIIILDEPTDGFSTDQLDKVREVLDELNSKQTIIVSHEPKMESFVENVIRIRKHEHASEVL